MSKEQARSFTFRIPSDVYEVFKNQVGKRERSRFLVQALRHALGMPEETRSTGFNVNLAAQTTELTDKLEILKTEQDKVLQRLDGLDLVLGEILINFVKPQLEQGKALQSLIQFGELDIATVNDEIESVLQEQENCKTDVIETNEAEIPSPKSDS